MPAMIGGAHQGPPGRSGFTKARLLSYSRLPATGGGYSRPARPWPLKLHEKEEAAPEYPLVCRSEGMVNHCSRFRRAREHNSDTYTQVEALNMCMCTCTKVEKFSWPMACESVSARQKIPHSIYMSERSFLRERDPEEKFESDDSPMRRVRTCVRGPVGIFGRAPPRASPIRDAVLDRPTTRAHESRADVASVRWTDACFQIVCHRTRRLKCPRPDRRTRRSTEIRSSRWPAPDVHPKTLPPSLSPHRRPSATGSGRPRSTPAGKRAPPATTRPNWPGCAVRTPSCARNARSCAKPRLSSPEETSR